VAFIIKSKNKRLAPSGTGELRNEHTLSVGLNGRSWPTGAAGTDQSWTNAVTSISTRADTGVSPATCTRVLAGRDAPNAS